jgi:hypothetical protein
LWRAGLTLAEIGAAVSRPLVGIDEETSELERLCLVARSHADALLASDDEEDDYSLSSSDAEDWLPQEVLQRADNAAQGFAAPVQAAQKLPADPMECTSSSCLSSGTAFAASTSFELSYGGSGRLTISVDSLGPSARGSAEDDVLLLGAGSSRSGEDLLFDLDDHHGNPVDAPTDPCTPSVAARPGSRPSVTALSPGVCSSLGDAPSLSFSPLQPAPCDLHPACHGDCAPATLPAAAMPAMARSVTAAFAVPPWQHAQHARR